MNGHPDRHPGREAPTAPGTKLFVNDYSTTDPDRLACLVQLVRFLKGRGIPIDGVGHQMHNAVNYPSVPAMVNTINTFANLGVDQQITEMGMSIYNAGDNTTNYAVSPGSVPAAVLARQGYLSGRWPPVGVAVIQPGRVYFAGLPNHVRCVAPCIEL